MKYRMKNKFYSLRDFYSEYFCFELAPGFIDIDGNCQSTFTNILFRGRTKQPQATRIKTTTRTDYFGLKSQRDWITTSEQIRRGAFFTADVPWL